MRRCHPQHRTSTTQKKQGLNKLPPAWWATRAPEQDRIATPPGWILQFRGTRRLVGDMQKDELRPSSAGFPPLTRWCQAGTRPRCKSERKQWPTRPCSYTAPVKPEPAISMRCMASLHCQECTGPGMACHSLQPRLCPQSKRPKEPHRISRRCSQPSRVRASRVRQARLCPNQPESARTDHGA